MDEQPLSRIGVYSVPAVTMSSSDTSSTSTTTTTTNSVQSKLTISGWAMIPFIMVCTILAMALYRRNEGRPLMGRHRDVLLWGGGAVAFFGISLGMMFLPLPVGKKQQTCTSSIES